MALLCGLKIVFGSFFCLLDIVLLDLGIEGCSRDTEQSGGSRLLPAGFVECFGDEFLFSPFQRKIVNRRRRETVRGVILVEAVGVEDDVGPADTIALFEHNSPFDDIS